VPSFLFLGETARAFNLTGPGPVLEVEPGQTVEAEHNPDPVWFDEVNGDAAHSPVPPAPPPPEPEPETAAPEEASQ
jgi:hypothetical protein